MNKRKEIIILGFALFAMFFGAGNLIFPPSIGFNIGKEWLMSGIGFILTGVGLPLLGVLSFTKVGQLENFSVRISSKFNTLYCTVLVLVIGPLFAIPRTGSTTIEMGIIPLFPNVNQTILSIIGSIIFFTITLLLVLKESSITDIIGKFLTPIILIILSIISFIGITRDIGTPIVKITENVFTYGFINGYQTMDALASVIFGVIIVKNLEAKGIASSSDRKYFLTGASIIAALGLGIIYFSLIYLGARISGTENLTSTTSAALQLAHITLGNFGKISFGICVSAACLTTSVGLVALASDWFSKITPFSYKQLAVFISVFSGVLAVGGVDKIIKFSIPILCILYPITIILILLNIFEIKNKLVYRCATYTTLLVIIIEVLSGVFGLTSLSNLVLQIPLAKNGFSWVIPCIIISLIAFVISKFRNKK